MNVVARLRALYQTVETTCSCHHCEGHEWRPLRGEMPRVLKMRPVRHRHSALSLWDDVDRMPIGGIQRYLNRAWARIADSMSRETDSAIGCYRQ